MTAPHPQLHPIPCDSCKHPHTDHLCEYCHVRLTERDKDFIAIVGCASHSTTPAQERIDAVIRELEKAKGWNMTSCSVIVDECIDKAIALLQAGGQHE